MAIINAIIYIEMFNIIRITNLGIPKVNLLNQSYHFLVNGYLNDLFGITFRYIIKKVYNQNIFIKVHSLIFHMYFLCLKYNVLTYIYFKFNLISFFVIFLIKKLGSLV